MSQAADAITSLLRRHPPTLRRLAYLRRHRRLPNLRNPRTFSEKVNWRILNDRRDLLRFTGDKIAMRAYAREHGTADLRLSQLYWSGSDVTDLEAVQLPHRWVLKPNNQSGPLHLGQGDPDIEHLAALTRDWLRSDEWERLAERWVNTRIISTPRHAWLPRERPSFRAYDLVLSQLPGDRKLEISPSLAKKHYLPARLDHCL